MVSDAQKLCLIISIPFRDESLQCKKEKPKNCAFPERDPQ